MFNRKPNTKRSWHWPLLMPISRVQRMPTDFVSCVLDLHCYSAMTDSVYFIKNNSLYPKHPVRVSSVKIRRWNAFSANRKIANIEVVAKLQIASILVSFSNSYMTFTQMVVKKCWESTYISESIYLSLNTRLQHTMKIIKVIFSSWRPSADCCTKHTHWVIC